MAENARTGFVWETFMENSEAQRGMERAGFKSTARPETPESHASKSVAAPGKIAKTIDQ
jgi:hypothetical protein